MGGDLMNLRDRIARFHNFALTNNLSIYNEDSTTAQKLTIDCVNKMKECLLMVDDLAKGIENIKDFLQLNYNEKEEELELTIGQKVAELKEQVNASYVCVFDENAMSTLELAGNTAKAVNECIKAVNMLSDLVLEVNDFIALNYVPGEEMLVVGGNE